MAADQKTVIPNEKSSNFGRSGGAYIPPAKLKLLHAQITDKTSEDYQRLTWEALKKSINGLINKVNVSNVKEIIPELFGENILRGRGLMCRSLMKAQAASQPFTPVFTAIVAVINTKFPMIGELLIMRLLMQFRRAYKRSDKSALLSSSHFIAHLVNQKIANEIVALQILTLLLERPTNDSVEVAVGYMRQVGAFLLSDSTKACNAVFERFRGILHEGQIDKRSQYMVEVLFQIRKDKFNDNVSIPEGLDIVEEEDQITHMIGLTDDLNIEDTLNIFHFDEQFLESEQKYEYMKREILGEESEEESGSAGDQSESEDEELLESKRVLQIQDQTNTNLVNLRRAIYLTIMSSLNFEECAHKLMKLDVPDGQEIELCNMIVECCSQERTYINFYGLLGERFCKLSINWAAAFGSAFEETYKTIHRFETNRLRNIAKFFAHTIASDALSWEVFALIRLTEADTTSSSRIFCKILFNDLSEALGLPRLIKRLNDKDMVVTVETDSGLVNRGVFDGLFPSDSPKNTRFAINYFTSIGLGALTEGMREQLQNVVLEDDESGGDSTSGSDSTISDSDSSDESVEDDAKVKVRGGARVNDHIVRRRSRSLSRSPRRNLNDDKKVVRGYSPARNESRSRKPNRRSRSMSSQSSSRSRSPRDKRRVTRPIIHKRINSRSPVNRRLRSRSPKSRKRQSRSRTRSRSPYKRRQNSTRSPRQSYKRRVSRSPSSRRIVPRSPARGRRERSRSVDRGRKVSHSPARKELRSPRGNADRNVKGDSVQLPVASFVHPSRMALVPKS